MLKAHIGKLGLTNFDHAQVTLGKRAFNKAAFFKYCLRKITFGKAAIFKLNPFEFGLRDRQPTKVFSVVVLIVFDLFLRHFAMPP
jgi:hypothetical protein